MDVILAHRPDIETPIEETVRAFNFLIDQGLAFYWYARPPQSPPSFSHLNRKTRKIHIHPLVSGSKPHAGIALNHVTNGDSSTKDGEGGETLEGSAQL